MLAGRDFTVDDIVQHVIMKALSGERIWNPEEVPLFLWLKKQIDSVMDAWIKRKSGKYEQSFQDEQEHDEVSGKRHADSTMENTPDKNSLKPEEILENKETTIAQSERIGRVFSATTGDKELEQLIDSIIETGSTKPAILATHLNLEINEINNRKKRFQRRISNLNPESG